MKYRPKHWLFEERNKVDEPLARLTKKKGGSKWGRRKERRVTNDTIEIQIILRDCEEQLYTNKMENLKESDKFLEMYNLSQLNQEEIHNMNRPIISNKIESVVKEDKTKPPNKQKSRTRWLHRQILQNI